MSQRLSVTIAKVRGSNTSEYLPNEIWEFIYYLYWAKEITNKVHSSIMNSIKVQYSMDTILMNSENSKASDPYKLLLDYSEKNNLTEKS